MSVVQVVIVGASGDLSMRKLMPSLASLASKNVDILVLGVARRPLSDDAFRAEVREHVRGDLERFLPRVFYQPADTSSFADIERLHQRLASLPGGDQVGRLFYLAVKPELFAPTVANLGAAGLLSEKQSALPRAFRRVVIEKPFGHDLQSAQALNRQLKETLREAQLYRIDHYLGKETVQNILGLRFHNAIFEPLWSRASIESVQITVAEELGMPNGRGAFYDATGALRDVVQNHMLQLLALVAMEPPATLEAEMIRNLKVGVLKSLRLPTPEMVWRDTVRAQYAAGVVSGEPAVGYRDEEGVARDSSTETFVAMRAKIDNWRWAGVPFLLRHGKRLAKRFTEIQLHFHVPPVQLFNKPDTMPETEYWQKLRAGELCRIRPNVLTLSIQPREAISLQFGVKRPGAQMVMTPAELKFDYREAFGDDTAPAYERLLLDAMSGDATLFLREDEIDASWRFADAIRKGWDAPGAPPVTFYEAGTFGPPSDHLFRGCEGTWSRGGT